MPYLKNQNCTSCSVLLGSVVGNDTCCAIFAIFAQSNILKKKRRLYERHTSEVQAIKCANIASNRRQP